jgi:hypothetical protein
MNNPELLISTSALAAVTVVVILGVRFQDQWPRDAGRVIYRLVLPNELDLAQVAAFTRSLVALQVPRGWQLGRDSLVTEIVGRPDGIEHRLRLPEAHVDFLLAQLRTLLPGVRLVRLDGAQLPAVLTASELAFTGAARPLRTGDAEAFASSLLAAMGPLTPGEELLVQQVVWPVGGPAPAPTRPAHRPNGLAIGPRWLRSLGPLVLGTAPTDHVRPSAPNDKAAEPQLGVALRVGARSRVRGRSRQLVGQVVGVMRTLESPDKHLVRRPLPSRLIPGRLRRAVTPITHAPIVADAREVAVLLGWVPAGDVLGLERAGGHQFPPDRQLPTTGYVVGRATYAGLERPVAVSPADALMHLLVTGPNGSGKSTFLINLLLQDIEMGGICLIDPKGDLARDFIDALPERHLDRLIHLSPAAPRVVPLNPLACTPEEVELRADQTLAIIRDQSDSWGVSIDEALRNSLLLLAANRMCLTEIPTVLLDEGFRSRLLAKLGPTLAPTVGEFFSRYDGAWSEGQRAQTASAVINKITPLIGRANVRAMLGVATPTWNMRDVLDGGKLLVVELPSGVIGPQATDIIGGLVAQLCWDAAQARAAVDPRRRKPASLVIDELPRFVSSGTNLPDVLARARGHSLRVVAAAQHLAQVRPDLRSALLSEARNKIMFQPAADDASILARALPGVKPEDLLTLPARTALASLVVGGRVTAPVSIATFPPPEPTGHGDAARAASSARYGRDRAEVEREIAARSRSDQRGPRRSRRTS